MTKEQFFANVKETLRENAHFAQSLTGLLQLREWKGATESDLQYIGGRSRQTNRWEQLDDVPGAREKAAAVLNKLCSKNRTGNWLAPWMKPNMSSLSYYSR